MATARQADEDDARARSAAIELLDSSRSVAEVANVVREGMEAASAKQASKEGVRGKEDGGGEEGGGGKEAAKKRDVGEVPGPLGDLSIQPLHRCLFIF